jgi:hypothetical protein
MIELSKLTAADIGRWVVYLPTRARGRIKGWNDRFVFVVYRADDNWEDYTAAATEPEDLVWEPLQNSED